MKRNKVLTEHFYTMQLIDCNYSMLLLIFKEIVMWTKPTATEMRFGFEVTMYVMNK